MPQMLFQIGGSALDATTQAFISRHKMSLHPHFILSGQKNKDVDAAIPRYILARVPSRRHPLVKKSGGRSRPVFTTVNPLRLAPFFHCHADTAALLVEYRFQISVACDGLDIPRISLPGIDVMCDDQTAGANLG